MIPTRLRRGWTGSRLAAFILVRYKNGHFRKPPLALSCDVGTGRVHRDSEALCRCTSGTGPSPGITSASPGIVLVIAALDYIMCSMSRSNDGAHEDCARFVACFVRPVRISDKSEHPLHTAGCSYRF